MNYITEWVFLWVLFSFGIGLFFGSIRTIGFFQSTITCIVLSPLLGFLVTMFFPTIQTALKRQTR